MNGGAGELNRFQRDPLKNTPIAPVALLRLATLQRSQGKSAEAVKLLELCRAQHEANLIKDPRRVGLAVALRYHHGLAIKETNKLPDAGGFREHRQGLRQSFGDPRCGLVHRPVPPRRGNGEARRRAEDSNESRREAGGSERRQCGHSRRAEEPARTLSNSSRIRRTAWPEKRPGQSRISGMHYEAAWVCRTLAQHEIEKAARRKLQQDALKKRQEELAKQTPMGQPVPPARLPEILITAIPIQPSEQRVRDFLKALIVANADALLSHEARLELAELHAQREEHNPAIALLRQTLDKEPPAELGERVRLRLGTCLMAKQDAKAALRPVRFG